VYTVQSARFRSVAQENRASALARAVFALLR
jgi:hypothetical protein